MNYLLNPVDFVSGFVAWLLLAMSLLSWGLIVFKTQQLRQNRAALPLVQAAFWQHVQGGAGSNEEGAGGTALAQNNWQQGLDAARLAGQKTAVGQVLPQFSANFGVNFGVKAPVSLAPQAALSRLERLIHQGLTAATRQLEGGLIWLATLGATAPFVGLLGTVWGIYHALIGISGAGQLGIEQVAAPVGEALIMTAAGLAVALPAVVAFNLLGRQVATLVQDAGDLGQDVLTCATEAALAPSA